MPRYLLPLVFMMASFTGHAVADSAAERLAQAVQIRTISHQDRSQIDYGEFLRFHDFLRASYPRVFGELSVEFVNEYSLLIRWPGTDPSLQPVLFTGHFDVVPIEPGTEEDWLHPPFSGDIAEGRIHGRGTLDDKLGVMSLLEAAEQLLVAGYQPRREAVFALGHDEEIGGSAGARMIAARMQAMDLKFAWMVDEGGFLMSDSPLLPDKPVALINVAEKGYLTLTLVSTGDGGHSSNPPKISTIGRLSNAMARIEANPLPPRLVGPVRAMFETVAPHVDQPRRFVFENLWLTGPLVANMLADDRLTTPFVRTTTALTMFNAGVKENVVPQRAEARVNFRLLPGDTPEMVVDHVRDIVDDPLVEISYEQWQNIPPVSDHRGPGFAAIEQAVLQSYPDAVVAPSLLMATTDTRHYIDLAENQYRFRGMMIASHQAKSVHGTNEFVTVESYEKAIAVARDTLQLGTR